MTSKIGERSISGFYIVFDGGTMNILTNHPGQMQSEAWRKYSTFVQVEGDGFFPVIKNVIKMHAEKRNYGSIVLGAGRADILFLLVNTLLFCGRRKCIIIDCLWYKNSNSLYHYLKKIIFKIADFSVVRYVVWATREIEAYSRVFGLSREKFTFIPYHHTINDLDVEATHGDYLFSGGNFGRDYRTLIEAVRGLPKNLLIASNRPELFEGMEIPNNVTIKGFTHDEYLKKMAGCCINIVALAPNLLHAGGQQTFLNSMYFGKPTIVLDPEGASDYIRDGVDGILIEPGNPAKLRAAIRDLLDNPGKAVSIGARGRERALQHSTESHFEKILCLVNEVSVSGKTVETQSEIGQKNEAALK